MTVIEALMPAGFGPPAPFEDVVKAVGEPLDRFELPVPGEPDMERLIRAATEFDIDLLLGPPPGA